MDISIIICTYDPDQRIFERCLKSIAALRTEGIDIECFLVDNNSSIPIERFEITKWFLNECAWAKLLVEQEQGLTQARMCGFGSSAGRLIVFFDDDNEPDANYLLGIVDYERRNPRVGAFGPGRVRVEYVDGADEWLHENKGYFQESDIGSEVSDDSTDGYSACFPYGTGLVLRCELLAVYSLLVSDKKIATSDRKGKGLSSAGDLQIVWVVIKSGFSAGKTPLLKLNHLIASRKSNRDYIRRFLYAGGRSYLQVRLEIFPSEIDAARRAMLSPLKASLLCAKLLAENALNKDRDLVLAGQIGSIDGYCQFFGKQPPRFVSRLKRYFKLK